VVGSRTFFGNSAEYFAQELSQIAREGARIVGGCCGSTPDFIKKSRLALNEKIDTPPPDAAQSQKAPPKQLPNRLWSKLEAGKKIVAVELDPPVDSDIRAFMAGAQDLTEAGADAITIADCPVSRARADSSLLACKLKRECDIDAIPHMTCATAT
jgi:homocysteine S-methyltransferase